MVTNYYTTKFTANITMVEPSCVEHSKLKGFN